MKYVSRRWRDVSISQKLYAVVGLMALLIVFELLTLQFAMRTLSAARALVGGEALWSKGQKNAAVSILRYSITRNEEDYITFQEWLKIPEGDHKARIELTKPNPDRNVIRQGFIEGHINHDDVDPIIDLLTRFYWVSYLSRAIGIWGLGDQMLADFKAEGAAYHDALVSGDLVRARESLSRLKRMNDDLTTLEEDFSYVLGLGSRWLEYVVLALLSGAVLVVETVGLSLTYITSRSISRGLNSLNAVARQIGNGQFSTRVTYQNRDEIGELANALNTMGDLLQKSYSSLEARVKARTAEVAESRDQLNIVLNGITDGITVIDGRGHFVYANETGARMCGFDSVEELLQTPQNQFNKYFEILNEHGGPFDWESLPSKKIFSGNHRPSEVVLRTRSLKTGETKWVILKSAPVFDEKGSVRLVVSISKDITESRRVEDSIKFLDEASRLLASSLDYKETLQNLASIIVPKIGDWCSIDVVEEAGKPPKNIGLAHHDSKKLTWALELSSKYPTNWNSHRGPAAVLNTGKSELYSDIPEHMLIESVRSEEHLSLLRGLGMKSVMIVPLICRSKTFGVMTIISAESRKSYNHSDLAFAEELARRAASAVDNALSYRQAQRAIEARDEFMSIASHELKTPITSLGLQIQMAKQGISIEKKSTPPPEKLYKVLDIANKQVERLTGLVEDLLDASRIHVGKFSFNFEEGNLSNLVSEMATRFMEQFKKAECQVMTDIEPAVTGYFDYGRIQQVMDNFFSNVVKYAKGSHVKITVRKCGREAEIVVSDDGPGISPEKQALVFERFERATSSRDVAGLGLGLYIVREIAKGHGGSIKLESQLQRGSKFTLTFPLEAVSAAKCA